MTHPATSLPVSELGALRRLVPGVALAVAVPVAAYVRAPLVAPVLPIPAMVITLLLFTGTTPVILSVVTAGLPVLP